MNDRRAFLRGLAGAARNAARADEARPDEHGRADEKRPDEHVVATADPWLERYSRQLVLPQWSEDRQRRIGAASVLVVGAGALGSPVATYLAGAGVGRIGVVDDGDVELSNLHRQHLHFTPDVGVPKAHSAVAKLGFLNPEVVIEPYQARLHPAMLEDQDLIVDCTDSFASRYAINAACCDAGVPLVEGGVTGFTGLVMAIRPTHTACYRCAFPEPPPPGDRPGCAEAGVLGPAAGVVGSLQALEALKLLAGLPALTDAFLQIDLATLDFLRVSTRRRDDCPDCAPA
jgi:molybdopterin-synthase adenylyltransferase